MNLTCIFLSPHFYSQPYSPLESLPSWGPALILPSLGSSAQPEGSLLSDNHLGGTVFALLVWNFFLLLCIAVSVYSDLASIKLKVLLLEGPICNPPSFEYFLSGRWHLITCVLIVNSLCRICSLETIFYFFFASNQISSSLAGMMCGSKIRYKDHFQSWRPMILQHCFLSDHKKWDTTQCKNPEFYDLWSQLTKITPR